MNFDEPQYTIAVDYPGAINFKLYSGDQLLYTSNEFLPPMQEIMAFAGLISDIPFDRVLLYRTPWSGPFVYIDDLHFAIPAPGALVIFALALGAPRRRRQQ